jgi:hypothetical protein
MAYHDFLQFLGLRVVAAVAAVCIVQDPGRLVCGGAFWQPPHLGRLQLRTRRLIQLLPCQSSIYQSVLGDEIRNV